MRWASHDAALGRLSEAYATPTAASARSVADHQISGKRIDDVVRVIDMDAIAAGSVDRNAVAHDEDAPELDVPVVDTDRAFTVFHETHRRRALGLAVALSGDASSGEEIVQEAFVSAFLAWDKVSCYERPEAWLMRVVANRSCSARRRKSTEARLINRLKALADRSPTPSVDPSSDADFVSLLVRNLPKRQAQCVALKYVDGQSAEEIAVSLRISVATVRVHLHRARHTMDAAISRRRLSNE